jgi:hypothetical protein
VLSGNKNGNNRVIQPLEDRKIFYFKNENVLNEEIRELKLDVVEKKKEILEVS